MCLKLPPGSDRCYFPQVPGKGSGVRMDVELDSSYTPHTFPKKSLESLSEEYVALSKQTIITFLNVLNTLLSFPTREIV